MVRVADLPVFAAAVDEAGGEVEDDRVVLARNVSAEGRSRAFAGGASVPVSVLAGLAEPLVARARPVRPAPAAARRGRSATPSTGSPVSRCREPLARYVELRTRLLAVPRPS